MDCYFPPPNENYFVSATKPGEEDVVGAALVIMAMTDFSVYLKPKGNYIDDQFIVPRPNKDEAISVANKLLKCNEGLVGTLLDNIEGN